MESLLEKKCFQLKDASFIINRKELAHKSKDSRALGNLIFDEESRKTCSSKEPNKLKIPLCVIND